jgi:hypothetical protein
MTAKASTPLNLTFCASGKSGLLHYPKSARFLMVSLAVKPYKSKKRNVGVVAYEAAKDFIKIQFRDGSVYLYTYRKPGKSEVSEMKKLAASGIGLTTFINKYVRDRYEAKLA